MPAAAWATFAPSISAFFDEASRAKLTSIGIDWHSARCFNLLPPSPVVGEWDAAAAAEVAGLLDFSPHQVVFAAGARVLVALGSSAKLSDRLGLLTFTKCATVVPVPHPSGLNRFWNDPAVVRSLREKISRITEAE